MSDPRLLSWLTREAAALPNVAAVLRGLCKRLVAEGVPVVRATTHIRTLHPEVRGVTQLWRQGVEVEELMAPHGIEASPSFVGSPVQYVMATREWLGRRLDDEAVQRFPIFAELRAEGITHYVMAPMIFSSGTVNAASWATDAPGGFAEEHVALLHRLQPVYNLVLELKALRRIAGRLLSVYLGNDPGERILQGEIRRGDTRPIRAAMLMVDLRHFTRLSVTRPAEQVTWVLNEFFDAVVPPVLERQGEVLKFIGDGVLAVFPDAACSARQAALRALDAAREMLARVPLVGPPVAMPFIAPPVSRQPDNASEAATATHLLFIPQTPTKLPKAEAGKSYSAPQLSRNGNCVIAIFR